MGTSQNFLTEKATIAFLTENPHIENNDSKGIAVDETKKVFKVYSDLLTSNKLKSAKMENLWTRETDNLLTVNQKELLSEVNAVVNNLKIDIEPTLKILRNIERKAKRRCSEEEKTVVLCAIAVGRHSLQYWHDNYEKWMIELGGVDNMILQRSRLKSESIEGGG